MFPLTLTIQGITIKIPVNDTQTKTCRKMDINFSDSEWVQFHIDQALGLLDHQSNPEHPDHIPF